MATEFPKQYDTIVIGGGHAGIEAALASARMGCQTLLITMNLDSIGQMSCNPSIGGLGKGTLVKEIDALGGEMGINTDLCGFQFRMLNTSKGPAVWSPRAQCDKVAYRGRMKWVCERQQNLDIIQAEVRRLLVSNDAICGVETSLGVQYRSSAVVITAGTFLRGLIHIGTHQEQGGRAGDASALGLSGSLASLGLGLGRMKTGTPPRVLKRTIDFSKMRIQSGDTTVPWFSNWPEELFHVEHSSDETCLSVHYSDYPKASILGRLGSQIPCHITRTTPQTAEIILANLSASPLYSGVITGVGPRYCPSIEDKIVRFPSRDSHQLFLEPEGITTDEYYMNGLSTSLPFQVQIKLIRTVQGCENAQIIRPAYAVEYDCVDPTQLQATLETKLCRGLFCAGQINGTSGYEEAAAQGILAGINASLRSKDRELIVLRRDQAYIGVLVDDLATKGTSDPYRMFTSRAEYRLLLRQDNADLRLAKIGHELGLISAHRMRQVEDKKTAVSSELSRLTSVKHGSQTLAQILSRPEVRYQDLPNKNPALSQGMIRQVEIEVKYSGYIRRQYRDVESARGFDSKVIPSDFDFSSVLGLSTEARDKLCRIRPCTMGQASRISGITPADLSVLSVWLKRGDLASASRA